MDNVVEITHSLNRILGRMERGEGILGRAHQRHPRGEAADDVARRRLRQPAADRPDGRERQGAAPPAAQRPRHGRPARPLARPLPGAARPGQHGPGLLPGLLNDPSSRTEFNETLAALHQVARDLQGFTADLESSDALLPRLVKDKEYGREVTEQLRQFVKNLNDVSAKLDEGKGHGREADQRPQDLRRRQRHHRRRQPVPGAALADPQPAEEGDREALQGHEEGDRGAGGTPEPLDSCRRAGRRRQTRRGGSATPPGRTAAGRFDPPPPVEGE